MNTIIFETDSYSIKRVYTKYYLLIKGQKSNQICNSISHIIPSIYNHTNNCQDSLTTFTADSVCNLDKWLQTIVNDVDYNKYAKTKELATNNTTVEELATTTTKLKHNIHFFCLLLDTLSRQIAYLKNQGYGFLGVELSDILVFNIDNSMFFLICSANQLVPIQTKINAENSNESRLFIDSPMTKSTFSSPETHIIACLPAFIHFNTFYYSLGMLLYFCLFDEYLLVANEFKTEEEMNELLEPIKATKLGGFFKRCFKPDASERTMLFI